MDLLKAIKTRRSVREFLDKEISDEEILKILDVARYAPSAGNLQDWFFFIIKDKEKIKEISRIAFNQDWIEKAAFLIVACSDLEIISHYGQRGISLYSKQDVACAIQNMLLFAWSLGIGSCWVGAFDEELLKKCLSIPRKFKVQSIIAFGYPRAIPATPGRKPLEKIFKFI